jgi:hypothetical protein
MTDGDDSIGSRFAIEQLRERFRKCLDDKKLITFCIGFGKDVKVDDLKEICKTGNGGSLTRSINGTRLGMYF